MPVPANNFSADELFAGNVGPQDATTDLWKVEIVNDGTTIGEFTVPGTSFEHAQRNAYQAMKQASRASTVLDVVEAGRRKLKMTVNSFSSTGPTFADAQNKDIFDRAWEIRRTLAQASTDLAALAANARTRGMGNVPGEIIAANELVDEAKRRLSAIQ